MKPIYLHLLIAAGASFALSAANADPLEDAFREPPAAAKPRVWWHWMNGNVTQEGIRKDLEWLHRVGIGGVDAIDASINTPQIVEQRLIYMSPGWKDAFRFAAETAQRLDLELSTNASPGWSLTGGPWVKPEQAIKKLVWTTTFVEGGRRFKDRLAAPPDITGPFQNIPYVGRPEAEPAAHTSPRFYADAIVMAYRAPKAQRAIVKPRVTSSAGPLAADLLNDGELAKSVSMTGGDGGVWIQLDYPSSQTISSAVLGTPQPLSATWGNLVPPAMSGRLQAQNEKGAWRDIATLNISNVPQVTVSFEPVTAKVFRVMLSRTEAPRPATPPWLGPDIIEKYFPPAAKDFAISELSLQPAARVNEFERKAGFAIVDDFYALAATSGQANAAVAKTDVLDLSAKMARDGSLDWTPPPGQWVVLRLGYSLTGMTNHPATPEATGLEVDKLNRGFVREYLNTYLDTYSRFLSPSLMGGRGLKSIFTDSTEVGPQNWTNDLIEQFQRLRGYDPRPWLPALTGVIVESGAASDKFLWDFRRTLAQLLAENHYGEIAAGARARGLKTYSEAIENKRQAFGDDMEMRRYADVPAGAMWAFKVAENPFSDYIDPQPQPTLIADNRGAASVAHLYGQNLAAAESFTACGVVPWSFSPRDLKPVADLEFALGINLLFIHTSVHQPKDQPPGLALGPCGQYFNRHETWAEQARPWVSYLSRSSYLLQQGRYVADVAYFYGEEAPLTVLQERGRLDDVPRDYAFDFVNADALLNLLKIEKGSLTTPSGMRYRALQLGGASERMTLPVLRKIAEFVRNGGIVIGAAPIDSPSLADDGVEFERLKATLWSKDGNGASLGDGRVYGKDSVNEALLATGLQPDFLSLPPHGDGRQAPVDREAPALMFVHRRLPDGEIYFLVNRANRNERLNASFRVAGKTPELWRAETGAAQAVSFRIEEGRTVVPLELKPHDAVFVVFRKPATSDSLRVRDPEIKTSMAVQGPWTVRFQPDRGAPAAMTFDRLASWSGHSDPGVKYFSGTASYEKTIDATRAWFKKGARLRLDLGEVDELAEVVLNGKPLGILWNRPYRMDITAALRPGANLLEVKVTNLWINRLVGDQQPGAAQYTFTAGPSYTAQTPLRSSGLLGPVVLELVKSQ